MHGNIIELNEIRQAQHLKSKFEEAKLTSNGFTLDYTGNKVLPDSGYAVSIGALNTNGLTGFRDAVKRELCVGYWDGDSDLTIIVSDLDLALKIGKENKQEAIYDFRNREVIWIDKE